MKTAYNVIIKYNENEKSLREKLLLILANAAKKQVSGCPAK